MTKNPKIIELSLFCEIPNTLFKGNLELQVARFHGSFNWSWIDVSFFLISIGFGFFK
jgi:hypothetical protein